MARSTGPVLAAGAITGFTRVIILGQPPADVLRIAIATGITAGGLYLLENVSQELAVGLAWIGLVTVLLVRVDPHTPSPAEAFATWWKD